MSAKKHQDRQGVVFSTDPGYQYHADIPEISQTLPPARQRLTVRLDTKARGGKVVTAVEGFVGTEADLEALARALRQHCGTGGSAKDGAALVQGDVRAKVQAWLEKAGYGVRAR